MEQTENIKILLRGGAIAAGKGASKSYFDLLKEKKEGGRLELVDRSRESDNSFDAVWTFHEDIDPFEPDVLILHFGMNDAYYPVYRSEFKENLVQIVRLARKRFDPEILLMTSHPFDNPHDMNMLTIYYRTVREVAVDLQCHLVSVHTFFRGYCDEEGIELSELVQKDTRYPSDKGHKLYAEIVENNLAGILKGV